MRVYLHGLGQTPASWARTLTLLGDEGGLCPDLAGLCRGQPATYENLYAGLTGRLSRMEGPVDLCGLSLGGVLALQYAIEHPAQVRSLVLIAAQYRMPRGMLRLQNFLFHLMPAASFQQAGFEKKELIRLCKSMMPLNLRGSLHAVACPALLLCGQRDPANQKAAKALAALLPGAALQILPNAGHEVNVEAPEALAQALEAFYQRI